MRKTQREVESKATTEETTSRMSLRNTIATYSTLCILLVMIRPSRDHVTHAVRCATLPCTRADRKRSRSEVEDSKGKHTRASPSGDQSCGDGDRVRLLTSHHGQCTSKHATALLHSCNQPYSLREPFAFGFSPVATRKTIRVRKIEQK
jgi:hypothetical protein